MEYGDSAQAETIRKMVVAMSRDVRVLVVKARRPCAQRPYMALRQAVECAEKGT